MVDDNRLERQAVLLGETGSRKISEVTLGIVGLSGNGSPLALGAACAGFQKFKLFDPDKLEPSNCNRFFAGGINDVGKYKVELVKAAIKSIDPLIHCKSFPLDVRVPDIHNELAGCDFILACPDNDDCRAFLQAFCLAHGIPILEVGSGVVVRDSAVWMLGCKMSFYQPGKACLGCISLDDEPMAQSHQSFVGVNMVAAGLALITLVGYVTGRWETKNFAAFNALEQDMLSMQVERRAGCPFCGTKVKG